MSRRQHQTLAVLDNHVQFVCPYLRHPRVIVWCESPRVIREHPSDWIVSPIERDPLRGRTGRTVLPHHARVRLRRIAAYGIPFQRIAIAHELDPEGPVAELTGRDDGPQICDDDTARRLVGAVPPPPALMRAVHLLDRAVLSGVATADATRRTLDPIVLGVLAPQAPRPGELSLWYPLTAWRW